MHAPETCLVERLVAFGGACAVSAACRGHEPRAWITERVADLADASRRLSRFNLDSELTQLNRCRDAEVSVGLLEALRAALRMREWSDGLVTPTLLPVLERIGYDQDYSSIALSDRRVGAAMDVPDVGPTPTLAVAGRRVRLGEGTGIDLGGTAKGHLADTVVASAPEAVAVLVELDGVIAASGPRPGGVPWLVPVTPPGAPRPVAFLALVRGGVATAAPGRRRWYRDGKLVHHLVDPRTGRPAATDVVSATVQAPSALLAQTAAKVVVLLGADAGLAFLAVHPELGGVVVRTGGTIESVPAAPLRP